jgi:hypothetical protein
MPRKPPADLFAPSTHPKSEIPFEFVLERIAGLNPTTRPMFGCTAVYVQERIVFVLRQKGSPDDGVWLAYPPAHQETVLALFPRLLRIGVLGNARGWRKFSSKSAEFEDDVLAACRLICDGDARFGKVPVSRRRVSRP